jgi:magnesium transporter
VLHATRDDVAASVLRSTKPVVRVRWLEALEPKKQKAMRTLLRYAGGTAGALMDPQILTIAEGTSVGNALQRLRHAHEGVFHYLYVVAQDNELVSVLTLAKALTASQNESIDSLATRKIESLSALATWDSIVAHPAWKRLHSLPVVDARGRFLGVVRYELLRKLEQELAQLDPEESSAQTGAALAELYGVGLRGLFAWLGSLGPVSSSSTKGPS